jgi:hypothetical protein
MIAMERPRNSIPDFPSFLLTGIAWWDGIRRYYRRPEAV